MIICKLKFSILKDFLILLSFGIIITIAILFIKSIVYFDITAPESVTFITEALPISDLNPPLPGDTVYDPITKRKIGTVTKARILHQEDGTHFYITAQITARPRTNAVRTTDIWFGLEEMLTDEKN